MFRQQELKNYVYPGGSWYSKLAGGGVLHRGRQLLRSYGQAGVLFAVFATLTLLACLDDSDRPSSIADQLRKNAEAFEYTIGKTGGELIIATTSEPETLNLVIANDTGSTGVLGHLFEGLTETSWLTDEVEPSLAESWTRSDDGLTWTFSLRKDVTWHDGTPFTAQDVEFTFNRIVYNEDIKSSAGATFNFQFLDDPARDAKMTVTVLDDYTVRFVLPVPFAPFLRSMGTAIYPKHILEPYIEDGTFNEVWDIDTDPAEVIGTGPFTIESYVPKERVVLSRNPDYWLKDDTGNSLPYLDKIVHLIVPDQETELARFKNGEADIHGVLGEEFAELEPLQAEGNFTIHRRGPNFGSEFLTFNTNPGNSDTMEPYVAAEKLRWFRNTQFRRAVAHSVDKDAIIRDVHHGFGYPQWSSISPAADDFHNPGVRRYEYDIAEANRILDSLGWVDTDGDRVREDDAGNAIEFSLITNTQSNVREKIGKIIQQGLGEIGVKADFRLVRFREELLPQLTRSYDWEAVVIGLTGGTDPHSGINVWRSSGNLHLWYPKQPQPATDWEAEIDRLYVRASQELDRSKRVALYHSAQEIVAENVPLIYTTHSERLTAVRNVFGNTTPTLYGLWDIRYLYRTDL